jgi:hypothetical protein
MDLGQGARDFWHLIRLVCFGFAYGGVEQKSRHPLDEGSTAWLYHKYIKRHQNYYLFKCSLDWTTEALSNLISLSSIPPPIPPVLFDIQYHQDPLYKRAFSSDIDPFKI